MPTYRIRHCMIALFVQANAVGKYKTKYGGMEFPAAINQILGKSEKHAQQGERTLIDVH